MELTRHFTATVYLVNDGAVALHRHPKLDIRLPPGGHVDRDELPHEAALREAHEETGLDARLVDDTDPVPAPDGETLPDPRHTVLYDIDTLDGRVAHQHVDMVYFAAVDSRAVDPAGDDEEPAAAWAWYTPAELREADVDPDTVQIGIEAVETVGAAVGE
ncbi:NUDIX hydrolase [Candidatus Halobonum tyrrellensis]|uniref:MutT/NUDIX family protein n=1 Tax=Candidatus Halobonum tyrrellensis G22 TaxID=1324957 RepID=V4HG17_9EURY|nr:NUDIX domain-containing protein [Candidatus Halobonum tyrrellensis]ESP89660.1 mutT/NUDIX family protein [Candidatus Halobonum tyrrellensis G22]